MPHLEMIRAAAEDLSAAQTLVKERTTALREIIRTSMELGATEAQVVESSGLTASELALFTAGQPALSTI